MAGKKDFDADTLAQTAEQHGKDIFDLTERVAALETSLKPEQLAVILAEASKDSKKLDALFSELFCAMMAKDENVKAAVENHVVKMDRGTVRRFFGKIGFTAWTAIVFFVGLVAEALIRKWIG